MHIIDWLGSAEVRSVGINLMRLSHKEVATQFGLGVSSSALAVGERAGYELRSFVPVYNRVLRLGYRLRKADRSLPKRAFGLARDLVGGLTRVAARPRLTCG